MPRLVWGPDGGLWGDVDDTALWGEIVGPPPPTPEPDEPQAAPPEATLFYLHQLLHIETNPPLRLTTFWTREIEIGGETYLGGLGHFNFAVNTIGVGSDGRAETTTLTAQLGDNASELRRALTGRLGGLFATVELIYSTDGIRWLILPNRIRGRLSNSSLVGENFSVDIVSETLEAYNREELVWSHENQLARTDGQDQGFRMARDLAEGKVKSRFPQWQ